MLNLQSSKPQEEVSKFYIREEMANMSYHPCNPQSMDQQLRTSPWIGRLRTPA